MIPSLHDRKTAWQAYSRDRDFRRWWTETLLCHHACGLVMYKTQLIVSGRKGSIFFSRTYGPQRSASYLLPWWPAAVNEATAALQPGDAIVPSLPKAGESS